MSKIEPETVVHSEEKVTFATEQEARAAVLQRVADWVESGLPMKITIHSKEGHVKAVRDML